MNFFLMLKTCIRSIMRNRMRSFLTSLGIIIGVGSVIIMLAVGQGTQAQINDQLSAMGTNLLQIMPQRVRFQPGQMMRVRPPALTNTDLQKIHSDASYASAISGVSQASFTEVGSAGTDQITVSGVEPEYISIQNRIVALGTMFGDEDLQDRNRVAVIGTTTAKTLFGNPNAALNASMRIGTLPFTVIGVLESKGSSYGQDQDEIIWVPLTTFQTRLRNTNTVNSIQVSVASKNYMAAEEAELKAILRETHGLSTEAASTESSDDFQIMNSADMIDTANEIMGMLTALLAAIAGVSLLVGGIGIMNIMLVSVTERTREIGIRMAVGAKKSDILTQFLTESVLLSLMGGLIGVALAAGVCELLTRLVAQISTLISPGVVLIAVLFSAGVGVFFGFYPAQKAAKMYPIDALRYE
ncbi:MAG: ABC transporter permease [Spirochaetaceae bacterium]|jgi:putative ABC transport system permease protein|nr:ABC transporter permease [Spirochaetaceae bacterium]